jgi:hypothetical protein
MNGYTTMYMITNGPKVEREMGLPSPFILTGQLGLLNHDGDEGDSPYLPKNGMRDWAKVYENTSLGPTTKIYQSVLSTCIVSREVD